MRGKIKALAFLIVQFLVYCIVAFIVYELNKKLISNFTNIGVNGYINIVLNFLKQIGLMFLFAALITGLITLIIYISSLFGRWRKIKVFISYKNTNLNLVKKLNDTLECKWIKIDFLPFVPTEHDKIVELVQKSIKKADLLLVLPGTEKSFVDAEIFAASFIKKPILFLKITEDQKVPDTSFIGYPIFDLNKLEKFQFEPLRNFILYVLKSKIDIRKNTLRTLLKFRTKAQKVLTLFAIAIAIADFLESILRILSSIKIDYEVSMIIYWIATIIAVFYYIIQYLLVIKERFKVISITRQLVRSGNSTYEMLLNCFSDLNSDKEIICCLNKNGLKINQ